MKKIHKKAAALLFAVTVAGVPLGTAFLGSTVGANVFAQATEMAAGETAGAFEVKEDLAPCAL